MARISDIHSIVVPAQSPNFSAHTYTEIYGGGGVTDGSMNGCKVVINGVYMEITASSNIPLWIKNISGGTGCWLLGENNDVLQGSPRYT